jgi:hypothetical protein
MQLGPEREIDRWQLGNDAFEAPEIEAGASDDQRNDSTLIQPGDRLPSEKAVFVDVAQFCQRDNSHQMVGNGCELRESWFAGQNVKALVKLEGVPADDFGLESLRHLDRKIRFTYCRRACQHHVPQFVHVKRKDPRSAKERGSYKAARTLIRSGCSLHIRSFGTADDQLSAKKLFIVKFLNSASSFLDGCHLNEGKAFGPLCILMTDDFSILNLAYPIK